MFRLTAQYFKEHGSTEGISWVGTTQMSAQSIVNGDVPRLIFIVSRLLVMVGFVQGYAHGTTGLFIVMVLELVPFV